MTRGFRLLLATLVLTTFAGCRQPLPVYDRFPQPLSMRDLVRAERLLEISLSEAELEGVDAALDRHQEAFEEFRRREIRPFLAELPENVAEELPEEEERLLRRRIARHRSLMERIEGFDRMALEELTETLGPDRFDLIERLRIARIFARANALLAGDGGRRLLDLRTVTGGLRLDGAARAAIEEELVRHDREAVALVQRIVDAQMRLPLTHREVLRAQGPPEADVAPELEDRERERAISKASNDRVAEARRELELALLAYQQLLDRTAVALAGGLPPAEANRLTLRIARTRDGGGVTRSGEVTAFEVLIARHARELPAETRNRLAALRERYLAQEAPRLARVAAFIASARSEREAGHEAAWQAGRAALHTEREHARQEFREAYEREVPGELREKIALLGRQSKREFPGALAEVVGAGAVSSILVERPAGFGDHEPAEAPYRRGHEQGDLQFLLLGAPTAVDLERLCDRAVLDENERLVLRGVTAAWLERWREAADRSKETIRGELQFFLRFDTSVTPAEVDRAIVRILAVIEEARRERMALDRELAEELAAAVAGAAGAPLELWRAERAENAFRMDWSQLPNGHEMGIPPLATMPFFDALALAEVGDADALRDALGERMLLIPNAGESVRTRVLAALHRMTMAETRKRMLEGKEEDVRRELAAVREAASRLAALHAEALGACAAILEPREARRLREQAAILALPDLAGGGESATRLLLELERDPSLDEEQFRRLAGIIDRREVLRDQALEMIFAWARVAAHSEPGKGDGNIEAARFARTEADARALRFAYAMLSEEQQLRHRRLLDWFEAPPEQTRTYD